MISRIKTTESINAQHEQKSDNFNEATLTDLQTTQANPISIAKSSALVSSKLDKSGMDKSLLVWTVIGEERASGFSTLGFFGVSAPSAESPFIYYTHTQNVKMQQANGYYQNEKTTGKIRLAV